MPFTSILAFLLLSLFNSVHSCARTSDVTTTTISSTTTTRTIASTTTTTTPFIPCPQPAVDRLGLTIDDGTTLISPEIEATPTHRCTSCTSARRNFYAAFTMSVLVEDAVANNAVSATVDCPPEVLCVCDAMGVCCQPAPGTTLTSIQVIPACSGTDCRNNLIIRDGTNIFTCDDGVTTIDPVDQYDINAEFVPLNTIGYFNVDAVGCSGCAALRSEVCMGPTIPVQ